jgi:hypothetical protein
MKKHKLAKNALKHPELFSPAELDYFRLWLKSRKERKDREKAEQFTKCNETLS